MICGGNMDVYIEPVTLGFTILIVGGGHIGKALARLATAAGFPYIVVDPGARREDFPEAVQLVAKDCIQGLTEVEITPKTCVVIATGSHVSDEAVLRKALNSNAYYIGMIGSKKKVDTIFRRLAEENIPEEKLKQVNAPIGLNIGAETPSEIAVSILAEIVSKIKGGTGKPLANL
jgi:xanthine dehydrogenase accessory factor